jgi:peptide/nickel transport system ATP-binding protein
MAQGDSPLLEVSNLSVTYGQGRRAHTALQDVSFSVEPGEVLGIVGESGSGKSTLARTLVGLLSPSAGQVRLRGASLAPTCAARPPNVLQAVQIVFQNPDASLNPKQTVRAILDHPLKKFMGHLPVDERRRMRAEVVERLRLPARVEERYPRELSGGQRQRVALARALVAQPVLLLCDEVTSALDVSVQATILELLRELTEIYSLTMLFVTHDLGVLRSIASRVVVLESGQVREQGDVGSVLSAPQHSYTRSLVASVPDPLATLSGGGAGRAAFATAPSLVP